MRELLAFAAGIVGKRKPGKDNYVEIRVNPQFARPFTARLCRKGKLSAGYAGKTLDEAVYELGKGESDT